MNHVGVIPLLVAFSAAAIAAVELAWFEAQPGPRIKLEWKTGTELDLSGFFVRRSEKPGESPENSRRVELEDASGKSTLYISPGEDNLAGSLYQYWDARVEDGKTYYYTLELIDNSNRSEFHGPVQAACHKKDQRE